MSNHLASLTPEELTATDLVDAICDEFGVSFDEAHTVLESVARALSGLSEEKLRTILTALEDGDFPGEE